MPMKIPTTIDVTLYGQVETLSPTLSKCRVRIFYKGMNRNRTYISDDFAEQLIASLPYAPIKGIFDDDEEDFESHGEKNTDGKVYGVVMENPNFAWEDHMDEDGVVRSYACADVVLLTGLYPEANLISGKSQSMEIFKDNLIGEWRLDGDGEPFYYFKKGCLVGLQVLGNATEPCFEGAAFFDLYKDIKEVTDYIKNLKEKEEKKKMDNTLFRLSDNEKAQQIEKLLNPNYSEEGGWDFERAVLEVYDDYALVRNLKDWTYERAYYTKENDTVTLGDITKVEIVDVTHDEMIALETIKSAIGTYEEAQTAIAAYEAAQTIEEPVLEVSTEGTSTEEVNEVEEVAETVVETSDFEAKIASLEQELETLKQEKEAFAATVADYEKKIETLETEKTNFEAEKVEIEQKLSDITSENETLTAFKKAVETEKKEAILTKYEDHLTDEIHAQLKAKIETYSIEDFKKEVCTAAVESDPSIFEKSAKEPTLIYTGKGEDDSKAPVSGVERILNNFKKNGGNK